MGAGADEGCGGILVGLVSICVTSGCAQCCSVRTIGIETSVRPAEAHSQAKAGNAMQQMSAEIKTRCRSAALPTNVCEMSQAALDTNATPTANTNKTSRLWS